MVVNVLLANIASFAVKAIPKPKFDVFVCARDTNADVSGASLSI